jgi:hypothetical protein
MRRFAVAISATLACLAVGPGLGTASAAAPDCPPDYPVTVAVGQTVTINGQCSDADGDGTLSYSITPNTGPGKGTFTGMSATSVTYAPFPNQTDPLPTTDGFDYTVTDGTTTVSAHVTITITGVPGGNGPPVCPESRAYTEKNTPIHLVNPCVDPEGAVPFGVAVTDPPHGTFVVADSDEGDYIPDTDYLGPDSFGFTISDGLLQTPSTYAIDVLQTGSTGPFTSASGATPSDPVVAGVTLPSGAPLQVTVQEAPQTDPPPEGFFFLGTAFLIEAPDGSASDPLTLTFTIDGSQTINGEAVVIHDGVPVDQPCAGAGVSPEPSCFVPGPDPVPGEDYTITIRSIHASRWNIGVRAKKYDFAGDLGGGKANAGRTIPLSFGLGGDEGLDVLEPGSPSSRQVDCGSGAPIGAESPVESVGGGLRYDAEGERYLYNWKTSKSWGGTCRELYLRLDDGSEHTATFRFG